MKVFVFGIFFFFHYISLSSQTVHTILVSTTEDPSLKEACKSNITRLNRELEKIQTQTGLRIRKKCILGLHVNTDTISNELQQIECKRDDVIFFHYSGHGINNGSKWPKFLIPGKKELSLGLIFNILKQKKPRLLIVLADTCNGAKRKVDIEDSGEFNRSYSHVFKNDFEKNNYSQLFKSSKGGIIGSSSRPGYKSYYSQYLGGYFTLCFFESINILTRQNESVSWENVFDFTEHLTNQFAKEHDKNQRPQFLISKIDVINEGGYYFVKEGDTLYSIAKKFNLEIKQIKDWNQLSSNCIKPNRKLKVANYE